ncbi:hypothetical protein XAUB_03820 [Xanthomonas citri pv. aurantifolii str. ICPB 11122]|nr:hypothetical protein XAUB_03820 [Xanthomonas citri pv. aurantifolii str. ICPB 11122]
MSIDPVHAGTAADAIGSMKLQTQLADHEIAEDGVVARIAGNGVVTTSTPDPILPLAAIQGVVPLPRGVHPYGIAKNDIVVLAAPDLVITTIASQLVVAGAAIDDVVAVRTRCR